MTLEFCERWKLAYKKSIMYQIVTANPLLSPPGGLFFSSTFEEGLNREGA